MSSRGKLALAIALPVIFTALDRLAKCYALAALSSGKSVVLFLGLEYGYFTNPGLVFSSFGSTVATIASALAFATLAILALRQRLKPEDKLTSRTLWPFMLIALGGASNVYDRLRFGGVTDYILFARSAWNIADIMILAGLLLMLKHSPKGAKADRSIKFDSGNTPPTIKPAS